MRTPIHPGEHLAEALAERGITPTELARQLDVPHNRITQIIQGKRAITGDTAVRLGQWFETSAEFWMNLQSLYDVRLAEQRSRENQGRPSMYEGKSEREPSPVTSLEEARQQRSRQPQATGRLMTPTRANAHLPALAAASSQTSDPGRGVNRKSIEIGGSEFFVTETQAGGTLIEGSFSTDWTALRVNGRPYALESMENPQIRLCAALRLRDLLFAVRHSEEVHFV